MDDVFDPYVQGPKPSATGYRMSDGVDLNQRYAPLSFGTAAPKQSYRIASGADFNTLWCKKGTASYNDAVVIPWSGFSAVSTNSHNAGATWSLTFNRNGTFAVSNTALQGGATSGSPTSGNWHKAPSTTAGDAYEIRFTAHVNIDNGYTDANGTYQATPSYTASTGWLSMATARSVQMDTSNLVGGSAGVRGGSVNVSGSYTIEIRKVGGTQVVTQTVSASVQAMV